MNITVKINVSIFFISDTPEVDDDGILLGGLDLKVTNRLVLVLGCCVQLISNGPMQSETYLRFLLWLYYFRLCLNELGL